MTDYYQKRYELHDAIVLELGHLSPAQLSKVLRYCQTLAADQPKLWDDTKKCIVCGRVVFKPARGPMPKFCSNKCRQKHYRQTRATA